MKTSHKTLIRFLVLAAAVLLPFAIVAGSLAFLPKIYGGTFLGELADKYALLCGTDEAKIVVVGGSSVAFGLNSPVIEEATGRKVVNFGLYATLGTKLMLDLSEANINRGDVVVLAPELNPQTLSLYFNATSAWQALEGDFSMLLHVGSDSYDELADGLFPFLGKKFDYAIQGRTVDQSGVYSHDSFNENGDIVFPRPYNTMTYTYDKSQKISLTPDIFDPEFVDYVNKYIGNARKKGAEVYFSFCPMNSSAMAAGTTAESVLEFTDFIEENLDCEIISNPWDSIMDAGYFFDTNFHLNDAGVTVHTQRLTNDLLRTLGKTNALSLELPAPPGKKPAETGEPSETYEEDPNEKYFLFETVSGLVTVTGVSEEGLAQETLTVPETWKGRPVKVLGKENTPVFAGCAALKRVTVGETLGLITDGAFADCPTLVELRMNREAEESLEASDTVFTGASDALKITFTSETAFDRFSSGYWWGLHASRMEMAQSQ